MSAHPTQSWLLRKPVARGRRGVVVAQAPEAAAAGLAILEAGGNAADAAVAAAFTLAATEPWNSGLGGIGFAVVHPVGQARASVVDFGPVSPLALDPAAFRLTGRPGGGDLFGWPEVADEANVHGPLSVCVPSAVAGYAALHTGFGVLPWREVLAPAIAAATEGLAYDWYAALRVLQAAATLRRYPETARIYVPGGLPRAAAHPPARVVLGGLAGSLQRLADAGARDFYAGDLAGSLVSDLSARGSTLTAADLAACSARIVPAAELPWRGGVVQTPGVQTAGPALFAVLEEAEAIPQGAAPDGPWYTAIAGALRRAQAARMGAEGCTSHLCVVDSEGGMVSLTTTLLSLFGSRMVLPQSGVLLNNGVMWFDPRPGGPNSIGPGKRPLTNMCPLVLRQGDAPALALGASGGRRILPAVAQMLCFVTDFGMAPGDAAATPRVDTSEPDTVLADARMSPETLAALAAEWPLAVAEPLVIPGLFAAPSLVAAYADGERAGVGDLSSPWSTALAEPGSALFPTEDLRNEIAGTETPSAETPGGETLSADEESAESSPDRHSSPESSPPPNPAADEV